jgi:site-specific DNA recombinase
MAVMFARSYVLQLSDNVKRKQEQMLRNGEWTGRPPIGYESIYDADGKRTDIVFDSQKSHLIQKMFELYATGNYSTLTIRDLMFKEGLQSRVGKPLALSMVDHILNNTFYYGQMVSNSKSYQHKYQPLITKELFDKCQRVRNGWSKKPFQYASKPFVLRGLVRCGKCGCAMSPEIKKGKFIYYSCTNAKKDICSTKVYIPEKDLLKPVYEVLEAFNNIPQEKIDELVEGLKQFTDAKNMYHKNAIDSFQSEYNSVQVRIDRLMDLLIDGSITKTDYDKKLKEFKEKQYDINIQLEEHTKADESYYLTASTVFNLAKDALELFESSEVLEKRAILNYVLQNYTVNEKTPCITMRSPFKELLSLTTQPMGLPR